MASSPAPRRQRKGMSGEVDRDAGSSTATIQRTREERDRAGRAVPSRSCGTSSPAFRSRCRPLARPGRLLLGRGDGLDARRGQLRPDARARRSRRSPTRRCAAPSSTRSASTTRCHATDATDCARWTACRARSCSVASSAARRRLEELAEALEVSPDDLDARPARAAHVPHVLSLDDGSATTSEDHGWALPARLDCPASDAHRPERHRVIHNDRSFRATQHARSANSPTWSATSSCSTTTRTST